MNLELKFRKNIKSYFFLIRNSILNSYNFNLFLFDIFLSSLMRYKLLEKKKYYLYIFKKKYNIKEKE
jgi:hypothetical protein